MAGRIKAAILGPGNIGTDLMLKIINRAKNIELDIISGVIAESEGLKIAANQGIATSSQGIDAVLAREDVRIVFDCTSAKIHKVHAPLLKKAGKIAIDLTPAAIGPYVVPAVNMNEHLDADNINLITCGGQATIPIIYAINRAAGVKYAEIVATISSRSAGPGTRQNIDEFTQTTRNGIISVGGVEAGKAIIILNPAEPPIMMRNTIYCRVQVPDEQAIRESVARMVDVVRSYVPGYKLKMEPILDGQKVTTMIEVEGEGAYLPKYSGNLDIITAAALGIADRIGEKLLQGGCRQEGGCL